MALMETPAVGEAWTGRVDARSDAGTKPIDFAYLKRFTLGNRELEREVLYLFSAHAPAYVDGLRKAATSKAWHAAAHTLKGSARAVGAWRVARSAEVAEKLQFAVDSDRCAFAVDNAWEALDEAIAYIAQVFPEA
jgi:HPt (histidine-containing phosphotransfer) domain-containing protein